MGPERIETGATTRTKTTVCRKSGTMDHPTDRATRPTWHDDSRDSSLDSKLWHDGWRDLQPSDRSPVKGLMLGGSSNTMATPHTKHVIWSQASRRVSKSG